MSAAAIARRGEIIAATGVSVASQRYSRNETALIAPGRPLEQGSAAAGVQKRDPGRSNWPAGEGTIRGRNMEYRGEYRQSHHYPMAGGCGCGCDTAWGQCVFRSPEIINSRHNKQFRS